MLRYFLLSLAALLCAAPAQALTPAEAQAIVIGETDGRITALQQAVLNPDERKAALLQALADDAVKVAGGKVYIVRDDKASDPATGEAVALPDDAEDVINNNRMRGEIDTALAVLKLFSPDIKLRGDAARAMLKEPDAGRLPLLDKALAGEQDEHVRAVLALARAAVLLASEDKSQRLTAAGALAQSRTPDTKLLLNQRLSVEADAEVKAQLQSAIRQIDDSLRWGERLGAMFTGLSLGSILLLAALGLAITYGLMGVINMAHGELIMIGAYATWVVQGVFQKYLPGAFDWYLVAAVPVAFAVSAGVGAVLERSVIRFLYGRPLETLLATWGISLVLMQGVRSLFGAQNVAVENPAWMSGGWQLLSNLTLPYNRLVIIAFALAVLAGMALLIGRTRLGLFVRGVTQNRPIASCMGVNTARIDTYAFSLGSGIAGLAGCALSQV
ncbi:MAG: urea ABC transporter permease subunit UrtB, partial [Hylemonella sp.]